MKFGQFMSYYKRKNFVKNFYKNCKRKTANVSALSKNYTGKFIFIT